ncbi:phosphotransferase [Granulosicoccus antarcticus]|uniref:CHK kinase-like domain-containing protein n=1 Tax=Granulosicoccus antarcticus IMCC3135 TaxID=1192854 RepID=A0A2Z2NZ36_9GAMM|nr:oxidoreductase family protein [Granulosicoccus antarcticus]ASJ73037.1 hypothetical protein IMCC3135_14760 [Granulosicoccus antarcticus IMCC3135]
MVTAMQERVIEFVKESLNASQVAVDEQLQALWGAQGFLLRLSTDVPGHETVIVKCIAPRSDSSHPRGWNTSRSFQRKTHSYEVECHWYEHFAQRCTPGCKVPQLLGIQREEHGSLILLEDLATEYPVLRNRLMVSEVAVCLRWLAEFHALFLDDAGEGLWSQGCYWHLETRPDEWQAMAEGPLKQAASWLDERLQKARFRTLVHGDAKVANFCFSDDMASVSAVDFQYVGKGCGMSDVVYLLGSCLSEADCRQHEQALLDSYFLHLSVCLPTSASAVEAEWRSLFAIAWADFHRFLMGWMPEHDKINPYTETLVGQALALSSSSSND